MPKIKTKPPPQTEILSETRRDLSAEPGTSPNEGLVDTSASEVETAPGQEVPGQEIETGTEDQPFTIDEGGEPTGTEEPSGDPLKDTQQAFHKTREELAQTKKVLAAMVANSQLGQRQAPASPSAIPPQMLSPEPTEDERLDPIKYVQRMMVVSEMKRRQESTMSDMQNFVDSHPDWQDVYPTMQEVMNEEPQGFQGPGALSRLYKRAQEREELRGYKSAMKDNADRAFQAGAQAQKQKGGRTFVSPSGGGGIRKQATMPADFARWPTTKQREWLVQHGLVKEDQF